MEIISCELCGEAVHSIEVHLKKKHEGTSVADYVAQFPGKPLLSDRAQAIVDADTAKRLSEAAAQPPITMAHAALAEVKHIEQPTTEAASKKMQMTNLFKLSEPMNNGRGDPLEITVLNPGPALEAYIPLVDDGHVWNNEDLKNMAMALELNIPLYLFGHKGTGKTTNFEQLSARTRRAMIRIQHSIGTEESHVVGQWTIQNGQTVFELGPLALAMKHGWIYLADEYDFAMPAVLAVYQAVLEGKSLVIKEADHANRVIRPHPNFRFWANGNTNGAGDESGLYSGTSVQNSANYDRFGMMLEIRYMPAKEESRIIVNRTGITVKEADKLVGFASDIRKQFEGQKISDTVSTRALINIANIGLRRSSMSLGVKLCFSNKLNQVDRAVVDGVAQRLYG